MATERDIARLLNEEIGPQDSDYLASVLGDYFCDETSGRVGGGIAGQLVLWDTSFVESIIIFERSLLIMLLYFMSSFVQQFFYIRILYFLFLKSKIINYLIIKPHSRPRSPRVSRRILSESQLSLSIITLYSYYNGL